jgi:hypothetical protein
MVILRTVDGLFRFRDALILSAVIFVLPMVYSRNARRFQVSVPAPPTERAADVEPELGPPPPCGKDPIPPYPGLDESATVKSWSMSDFGRNWKAPACIGWTTVGFTTLVTTVARFRYTSETQSLLRHIGAISELAGMRYWSTTHKRWQTLVVNAYALTDSQSGQRRDDFTPDELKEGKVLYFQQVDNLSGKGVYRIHIAQASADRVVFDVENISMMRYFFIPIFPPGEVQSIYFLDRASDHVWRYYNIVRTGKNANRLVAGNESSAVNRAVAFYRWFRNSHRPRAARGTMRAGV